MKKYFPYLGILVMILAISGCGHITPSGYLFTRVITPLDKNFSRTPSGIKRGKSSIKHFHYYVDVKWDSNAIGEIAKRNGFETIYFADIEILSILGYWNQYTVHVYGE